MVIFLYAIAFALLIAIVIGVSTVLVPTGMISCVYRSIYEKDSYDIFLSYKEFKKYYWLNPDKYYFKKVSDHYYDTPNYTVVEYHISYQKTVTIGFKTPIDYYLFYKWNKRLERERRTKLRNDKTNEYTEKFIRSVQEDIDKLKELSKEELNEAKNILTSQN